jgi:hypothetical protein
MSSFLTTLPAAILETILTRLALLFLAGAHNDPAQARQAAAQMLASYHPETEDELRLAANIISFSFHALEALSQSAHPDMPLTTILRLRGSAVSLSRESHKAQRRLDQVRKARRDGVQPSETTAQPEPTRPQIDKAMAFIEATRQAIETASKDGGKTWTQSYRQRETAKRIAANLKKNQAVHAATNATTAQSASAIQYATAQPT